MKIKRLIPLTVGVLTMAGLASCNTNSSQDTKGTITKEQFLERYQECVENRTIQEMGTIATVKCTDKIDDRVEDVYTVDCDVNILRTGIMTLSYMDSTMIAGFMSKNAAKNYFDAFEEGAKDKMEGKITYYQSEGILGYTLDYKVSGESFSETIIFNSEGLAEGAFYVDTSDIVEESILEISNYRFEVNITKYELINEYEAMINNRNAAEAIYTTVDASVFGITDTIDVKDCPIQLDMTNNVYYATVSTSIQTEPYRVDVAYNSKEALETYIDYVITNAMTHFTSIQIRFGKDEGDLHFQVSYLVPKDEKEGSTHIRVHEDIWFRKYGYVDYVGVYTNMAEMSFYFDSYAKTSN